MYMYMCMCTLPSLPLSFPSLPLPPAPFFPTSPFCLPLVPLSLSLPPFLLPSLYLSPSLPPLSLSSSFSPSVSPSLPPSLPLPSSFPYSVSPPPSLPLSLPPSSSGIIPWSPRVQEMLDICMSSVQQTKTSVRTPLVSLLLRGTAHATYMHTCTCTCT